MLYWRPDTFYNDPVHYGHPPELSLFRQPLRHRVKFNLRATMKPAKLQLYYHFYYFNIFIILLRFYFLMATIRFYKSIILVCTNTLKFYFLNLNLVCSIFYKCCVLIHSDVTVSLHVFKLSVYHHILHIYFVTIPTQ